MTHFSVAIIINNEQDAQRLLAPYQENNCGDCPKEYLKFHDIAEEYIEEYKNGTTTLYRLDNGAMVKFWQLREKERQDTEPIEMKNSSVYSFREYLEHLDYEWNEEKQTCGYWYNPNAKWDSWCYGGRFLNKLILKDGDQTYAAAVKDIDFDKTFPTWAFITKDGEWIEEANMGWFGMHDESTEDKDFAKKFMKFIKEANDNDTLCIIDCHI